MPLLLIRLLLPAAQYYYLAILLDELSINITTEQLSHGVLFFSVSSRLRGLLLNNATLSQTPEVAQYLVDLFHRYWAIIVTVFERSPLLSFVQ